LEDRSYSFRSDHAIGGDADVQSCGRDIHDGADGDDQRRDEWGNDLLHDERDDADDVLDAIHRSDYGKRDGDDRSDRGGDGVFDERGGDSRLYDFDVSGDADVQSCGRDIHDGAGGDDQRRDEWCDDLLHDERDDADDVLDAIHRSDYGKRDGDDRGDRGGEWIFPECGGKCGVYDHATGSDTGDYTGDGDVHHGTDGDDQRRDEWCDDLLHDERVTTDHLVHQVHRDVHSERNDDGKRDCRGEWIFNECDRLRGDHDWDFSGDTDLCKWCGRVSKQPESYSNAEHWKFSGGRFDRCWSYMG
jgi:hypothetical protein